MSLTLKVLLFQMPDTRDKDAILHISTAHHQTKIGTNRWLFNMGNNTNHGKNVARLTPTHALVPNVFPNVKAPYNTYFLQPSPPGGAVTEITVPPAFYSATDMVTVLNAVNILNGHGDIVFDYIPFTGVQNVFTIENQSLNVYRVGGSIERYLGTPKNATFLDDGSFTIPAGNTVFLGEPNLGGERIVHLKSEKLGHANAMMTADATTQDVMLSVPLHDTPYGGVARYTGESTEASQLQASFDVQLDKVDLSLWDADLNPLELPDNHHIELQFRMVHGAGNV
jgi:hypothetical protein